MQHRNSHACLANIRETMQIREGPSSWKEDIQGNETWEKDDMGKGKHDVFT